MNPLKLLILVFDERSRDHVEETLAQQHVGGFTEIPGALGEGTHGKRLTSALYPGANGVVLTVIPESQVPAVRDALLARVGPRAVEGTDRVPIRIAVVPVDAFW